MTFKVKSGINIGNKNIIDSNAKYQQTYDLPTIQPTLNLDFVNTPYLDSRITFTRASNATFTSARGLIETAVAGEPRFNYANNLCDGLLMEEATTNLLVSTSNFGGSSWSTDTIAPVITPYAAVAPDGTHTATLLEDQSTLVSGGTAARAQSFNVTASTNTYVTSCYVKAGTSACCSVRLVVVGPGLTCELCISPSTGQAQWRAGNAGAAYGIIPIGNGWYRVWLSIADNGTGTGIYTLVRPAFASTYSNTLDQAATGSTYFWGMQVEQKAFPTTYVPSGETFTSRASLASYRDGTDGLIKYAGYNLVPNSTAGGGVNLTISNNTLLAPDNTVSGMLVDVTSNFHAMAWYGITVTASTTYTFSFYVQRGTMPNMSYSVYNVTAGNDIVAATDYTSSTTATGWARIIVTFTTPVGCTSVNVYPIRDSNATGTVGIWGAQLELGSSATLVSKTTGTASAAARPAYNPTGTTSRRLLLEDAAATNLVFPSTIGSGWSYTGDAVINNATAPDGTTTATTLTVPTISGGLTSPHTPNITVSSSTVYTWSMYVKLGTALAADYKFAVYDLTNSTMIGVDLVPSQTPNSGAWTRVTYTFTTPATCTSVRCYAFRNASSSMTVGTMFFWGAQLELGSAATSYIPTTTASATRSADVYSTATATRIKDVAYISSPSGLPWFTMYDGTFVASFTEYQDFVGVPLGMTTTARAFANSMYISINTGGVTPSIVTNNASQTSIGGTQNKGAASGISTVAFTTKTDALIFTSDGNPIANDSTVSYPSTPYTWLSIGCSPWADDNHLNGTVRYIEYYPTALSNTEILALAK